MGEASSAALGLGRDDSDLRSPANVRAPKPGICTPRSAMGRSVLGHGAKPATPSLDSPSPRARARCGGGAESVGWVLCCVELRSAPPRGVRTKPRTRLPVAWRHGGAFAEGLLAAEGVARGPRRRLSRHMLSSVPRPRPPEPGDAGRLGGATATAPWGGAGWGVGIHFSNSCF